MDISQLLKLAIDRKASDLHLSAGLPPIIRIDGHLQKLDLAALEQDELCNLLNGIMNEQQQQHYKEQLELDFAFQFDALCRLRVNIFRQARGISAVFRIIPNQIKTLDELQFPAIFKEIASYSKGLVLVTGPTGSGKSTTLAALISYINNNQYKHIVTIEDPIEFIYKSANCLIHQREVHRDTYSFQTALRSVLREDPNIILLGELRCHETIRLALTAAETGHLVFATLHTNSAASSINRIIDAFSGDEKSMIRSMLSESLQAVIAQSLLTKIGGGRVAAFEIMISNPAIKNLIREDKIAQIYSAIQTGQKTGMQTLEQYRLKLIASQLITEETVTS
jgi:twitching motility protein PilT